MAVLFVLASFFDFSWLVLGFLASDFAFPSTSFAAVSLVAVRFSPGSSFASVFNFSLRLFAFAAAPAFFDFSSVAVASTAFIVAVLTVTPAMAPLVAVWPLSLPSMLASLVSYAMASPRLGPVAVTYTTSCRRCRLHYWFLLSLFHVFPLWLGPRYGFSWKGLELLPL